MEVQTNPEIDAFEDLQDVLSLLGLSEYQTDAYEALLMVGEARASTIGELIHIQGRSKIYSVLGDLQDKGLVDAKPTSPKTFVARNPTDVLRTAENRRRRQREQITQARRFAEECIDIGASSYEGNNGSTHLLEGRKATMDRLGDLITEATERIHMHTTPNASRRLMWFDDQLQDSEADVRFEEDEDLRASWILVDDTLVIWQAFPDDTKRFDGGDETLVTDAGPLVRDIQTMLTTAPSPGKEI